MAFDPNKHLRPMKGGAEYLDVKWRLVWLREDHPDAEIETRALEHEPGKWATFVARVAIPGAGSATGHGSESAGDFRDYYEKAETKALGRALASLGYGTQFVGNELDEGERIVDSPVERPAPRPQPRPAPAAPAPSGPHPLLATIRDDEADPKKRKTALHNYLMGATTASELARSAEAVKGCGMPESDLTAAYNWHADRIVKAQPASYAG